MGQYESFGLMALKLRFCIILLLFIKAINSSEIEVIWHCNLELIPEYSSPWFYDVPVCQK